VGTTVPGEQRGSGNAFCGQKQELVGGGAQGSGSTVFMTTNAPYLSVMGVGWEAAIDNTLNFDRSVTPVAICRKL
jgi:hypothetical protein